MPIRPIVMCIFAVLCIVEIGWLFYWTWDYAPFCDEAENLYAASLIAKGLLPYQDYWTNHAPGVHLLFAPVFVMLGANAPRYQALFVGRLVILCLIVLSQIYVFEQLLSPIWSGAPRRHIYLRKLLLYAGVAAVSYLVSLLLMTNQVWSESLLYCYLLVSVGYFLGLNRRGPSYLGSVLLGLASGGAILVSVIAVPTVLCILCFIIASFFMTCKNRRTCGVAALCLLGGVCLPLGLCAMLLVPRAGWCHPLYAVWGINNKYIPIVAFGLKGALGAVLKPVEFIGSSLMVIRGLPRGALVVTPAHPLVSFPMAIVCFIVLNYLLYKPQGGLRPWWTVAFLGGVVYSSLIRGEGFHVGHAFNLAFLLSIGWLILLVHRVVLLPPSVWMKILLFIPLGANLGLLFNGGLTAREYALGKAGGDGGAPETNSTVVSGIRRLRAAYDDADTQRYRIWIPAYQPHQLLYGGLAPAGDVYMLFPAFKDEPYFLAAYEKVLADENVLLLPVHDSKDMPASVRRIVTEKFAEQSAFVPPLIDDFEEVLRWKAADSACRHVTVQTVGRPCKGGVRLAGMASRGYQYSFFFDCPGDAVDGMKFIVHLSRGGTTVHTDNMGVAAKEWKGNRLRVDYVLGYEAGNLPVGDYILQASIIVPQERLSGGETGQEETIFMEKVRL